MNKTEVMNRIGDLKLLPVVVIKSIEDAEPTLAALEAGGLPAAEITFRTACAPEAIRLACEKFPNMLVGAGTVINPEMCKTAIECGAQFIVSPGFSAGVCEVCKQHDIAYLPGCVTPTEIMAALEHGIEIVKFFPASNYGGLSTIKALGAAFPTLKFMPTGGINEDNVLEYLDCDNIFSCGGSWMMQGSYDEIAEKTRRTMDKISSRRTGKQDKCGGGR